MSKEKETVNSEFKCKHCNFIFKPTIGAYIKAPFIFGKKHLKCPNCKEKGFYPELKK